jgi:hypothetical protein
VIGLSFGSGTKKGMLLCKKSIPKLFSTPTFSEKNKNGADKFTIGVTGFAISSVFIHELIHTGDMQQCKNCPKLSPF